MYSCAARRIATRLRFALTGEGGLNDGTAFPFVLLGLGLLGLHEHRRLRPGAGLAVDLVWGTVGGLGIGFALGSGVARGVRALRAWRDDAVILDEFLLLGVIGLSYGAALAAHTLGFLAVFAAGLALRRADDMHAALERKPPTNSPLTPSMLNVNEQLERIVEVAIVLLVGAMISTGYWSSPRDCAGGAAVPGDPPAFGVAGRARRSAGSAPRRLLAWFGIRGIGSVYYAVYVAAHDIRYGAAVELLVLRVHRDRRLDRGARCFRDAAHGAVPAQRTRAMARERRRSRVVGQTMTARAVLAPTSFRCTPLAHAACKFHNVFRSICTDGSTMDWDRISGNWAHWKGRIRERWGRLDRRSPRCDRRPARATRRAHPGGLRPRSRRGRAPAAQLGTQSRSVDEFDEADLVFDDDAGSYRTSMDGGSHDHLERNS